MGWETGVTLAAGGAKGFADIDNAKDQTKAIAQSAENTAANMANQTSRQEGSLETSFLKGGIALGGQGTGGPSAFFTQAGAQGTTDINRTISNANANISNTMNAARTSSLNTIAQSFAKIGPGSISTAWNGISGNPDPSPISSPLLDSFSTGMVGSGTGSLGGANGTGMGSGIQW